MATIHHTRECLSKGINKGCPVCEPINQRLKASEAGANAESEAVRRERSEHTPTPWRAENDPLGRFTIKEGGIVVAQGVHAEFAPRIVRAVNSHEGLIQELNHLIATLESVRANVDSPEKSLKGSWYSFDHMISDDISRTRKAIAQAEREGK